MTTSGKALLVSAFLVLIVSTALAQQPSLANEKEQKRQAERQRAIAIVEQTAAEAPLWNEKKAAVQILVDAADLLWDETPEARKWLVSAWTLIDQVTEPAKNERLKEFFNPSLRTPLRTAVLAVARKHDAQLAEKFLEELSRQPDENKERGAFDERSARSEQLLSLAQKAIDENPQLAFSLAESSLTDGISQGLQNVLTSLRQKNVALANRLFDSALLRFSGSVPDPSEAEILAGYLFQSGLTFSANSGGHPILIVNPDQRGLPAVALSEPLQANRFLVAVYQSLLSRPVSIDTDEGKQRAQRLLVLGNHLLGRYNNFAPELAPAARGFLAQLQGQLGGASETSSFPGVGGTAPVTSTMTKALTREELYDKRLNELEEAADNERIAAFKKLAYVQAALAARPEDYSRAKRVAEKIADDNLRSEVVCFLLYRAALSFVEKDEIEKAVDLVPQIGDSLRRAVVKIAIAQRLVASNRKKVEAGELRLRQQRAFDLLVDIDRDLKKDDPSPNAAKIALGRTAVLAKLDQAQALVSLEQAVEIINKLERVDLRDSWAPDLGLGVSATSGQTVARPKIGFDFRSAIEPLIQTNFEPLLAIVERLARKEVNGVGRLEMAKLVLGKKPPTSNGTNSHSSSVNLQRQDTVTSIRGTRGSH